RRSVRARWRSTSPEKGCPGTALPARRPPREPQPTDPGPLARSRRTRPPDHPRLLPHHGFSPPRSYTALPKALQFVQFYKASIMPTRRIFFTQLALDARIGILEHELRATQPLHIDAEFDVDVTQEVHDQNISTVLDYR